MKLLCRGKANINMPDGKSGRTPLHHAVERDDLSTVGYLILEVCFKWIVHVTCGHMKHILNCISNIQEIISVKVDFLQFKLHP